MADISAIKLPDNTTYNIKDKISGYTTNTGTVTSVAVSGGTGISVSGSPITSSGTITVANTGATGVKGSAESSYRTGQVNLTAANVGAVSKSDELLTTNPFAPGSLKGPYISKIDNAFYAADKRWTVTQTGATSNNPQALFNGSYEDGSIIINGNTAIITIEFPNETNGYFPGYPYGYFLMSFYYAAGPQSVSARVYCNYEPHGIGWKNITFSPISDNDSTHIVYRSSHQDYAMISKMEFTIVGDTTNSYGYTRVCQLEMHLDRPDSSRNPFLSKYRAETLYYDLTAPNFIGNLTGNATGSAGSVAWTGVTGKPSSTGNSTTGISIADHSTTTIYGVGSPTTSVTGVDGSTSVYGVKSGTNSTTTASKASGSNGTAPSWTFEEISIPNVTAAGSASSWTFEEKSIPNITATGSGSASLTFTMDTTDTKKLKIAFSHTHNAPTLGTAIKVQSKSGGSNGSAPTLGTAIKVQSKSGGSNGSASTWSFSDVTVPIRADSATTIPIAAASATTVPVKDSTATTVVTSKTHSVTDNGHTHTI